MGRSRKKLSDQPFEVDISSLDAKGLGLALHEDKTLRVFDKLLTPSIIVIHQRKIIIV